MSINYKFVRKLKLKVENRTVTYYWIRKCTPSKDCNYVQDYDKDLLVLPPKKYTMNHTCPLLQVLIHINIFSMEDICKDYENCVSYLLLCMKHLKNDKGFNKKLNDIIQNLISPIRPWSNKREHVTIVGLPK